MQSEAVKMQEAAREEPATLLDYVPELVEELARLKAEEDSARAELRRIDGKSQEAELAFYKRKEELRKPDRSRVLAEAALAGKPPPPEPKDPPGPPLEEIEGTIKGLRAMRAAPEKRIEELCASLAAKTRAAFREAAERAAVDYADLGLRLASLHAVIGAAQIMAGSDLPSFVVGQTWNDDFTIPGSEQLRALEEKTRLLYFKPVIAGGDREGCWKAAQAALDGARAELTRRLGRWPLDRR